MDRKARIVADKHDYHGHRGVPALGLHAVGACDGPRKSVAHGGDMVSGGCTVEQARSCGKIGTLAAIESAARSIWLRTNMEEAAIDLRIAELLMREREYQRKKETYVPTGSVCITNMWICWCRLVAQRSPSAVGGGRDTV